MKVLVCSSNLTYPIIDGGSLRIFNIFRHLSKENDIYFCLLPSTSHDIQSSLEFLKRGIFKGVFCLDYNFRSTDRLLSFFMGSFFNRETPQLVKSVEQRFKEIVKTNDIDILHVHLLPAGLLLANFDIVPKVLDLTDSWALYMARQQFVQRNPLDFFVNGFSFSRAIRNEKFLLQKFNAITVVSQVDLEYLKKLGCKTRAEVIRDGVEVPCAQSNNSEDYPSILFSGNMNYYPNIDATLYIAHEILPIIKLSVPNVKFYIVGANPSEEITKLGRLENIIVTGFVNDIHEYFSKATIVLAPMRMGSGMQNKVLEAMASGKPVVATPIVAAPFPKRIKACLVIGDSANDIAQKTLKLLANRNLRETVGQKGLKVVKEQCTWSTTAAEYSKLYTTLTSNSVGS